MASQTRSERVLVLRKTKLGETDLILTFMCRDGSQAKAVAKGARKPSSSFSSRLEVGCVADIFVAQGKSLDIVKEARSVSPHADLRNDPLLFSCASVVLELFDKVVQPDLPVDSLFDVGCASLNHIEHASSSVAVATTAATVFKSLAFLGMRPSFTLCSACAAPLTENDVSTVRFSPYNGGALCETCAAGQETTLLDADIASWAQLLLFSTFDELEESPIELSTGLELLQLAKVLLIESLGIRLKSIEFVLTVARTGC